ncbi:23S rRNA pseudouridine(955/2504/2580) synthase RluC [Thiosocius teredinicola]|uniref:23S rRNA pseudouridine(955/2504/2580) synthase RluC n=1 Tax=Thiosocius teredinicola TaxID=1973002 RepID=UPI000990BFC8
MAEGGETASRVRLITVDDNHDGQRLDNYLLGQLKGVPRSWVYRVLRRGEVRVNKGRCKPARRLQAGDVVRIPPLRVSEKDAEEAPKGLQHNIEESIIYEDNLILIVNKPGGVAVHGGSGVSHGVIEALRASRPNAPFLELAHRLDRETSGCLMLAKKRSALRSLQELQLAGKIEKRYLALLSGRIRKGRWRADAPLKKNTLKSGERVVRVDPEGKQAISNFEVLQRFEKETLVSVELETGRTHQIRVHAADNGTPILGDPKYGDEEANRVMKEMGLRRLFLHAASLRFDWPEPGNRFQVEAPLPTELQAVLDKLAGSI